MLSIDSLHYEISGRVLFNDLGLTLKAGEHIVVVGDSGSGKSTLLKLIADCGHQQVVLQNGCSTTMVMQQGALLDHLSVVQNLELVARYSGSDASPQQLLENLNVDASLHHHAISQLSGGQKRRVAIARALLTHPDILLFDEPDAGLDIANLEKLGATVKLLTQNCQTAAITISHNPFFIARIASKVYRLSEGSLQLVADWSNQDDAVDFQQRQLQLQQQLGETSPQVSVTASQGLKREWIVPAWLQGVIVTLKNLLHWPISVSDELKIGAYTYYLGFVSGALFFALVGLMLGSTVIAVVKMLTDTALTGLIAVFITPDKILDMMGGTYVLYLGPAIGGMLFAARSGSIVCNWLGEMVRGKQVQALQYLQVPPGQYLTAPATIAMFLAAFTTILWFAAGLWVGGLIAANLLFGINDPTVTMQISKYEIEQSLFWQKALIYSALVSLTIISLGMANKSTAHEVNIYTTKAIIYSTLSISLAELIIILS